MTNFEKWLKDNVQYKTFRQKQVVICSHYEECFDCPFYNMNDCSYDSEEVQAWLESEVDT